MARIAIGDSFRSGGLMSARRRSRRCSTPRRKRILAAQTRIPHKFFGKKIYEREVQETGTLKSFMDSRKAFACSKTPSFLLYLFRPSFLLQPLFNLRTQTLLTREGEQLLFTF